MKTWNYIAAFLSPESKETLKEHFGAPSGWVWYGDHVTLAFNNLPDPDGRADRFDRIGAFGTHIEARLQHMAIRHNVIAVQVTFPDSVHFKGTYHITLATAPDVPPKESNNIPEECWMPLDSYHRLNLSCRIGYSLDRQTFYTKPDNQNNSQI